MSGVAIVEDHGLFAHTLVAALTRDGVAAVAVPCAGADHAELAQRIAERDPAPVLVDLDLGEGRDGAVLVPGLVQRGLRVMVVTGTSDRLWIASALENGAIGYLTKDAEFDTVLAAVRAALRGRPVLDQAHRAALMAELRRARAERDSAFAPFERLTAREREVLQALADGRSVSEIADDWVVSDTTVRAHVRGVLAKLGTSSQLAAVAAGLRSGWLRRDGRGHLRPRGSRAHP